MQCSENSLLKRYDNVYSIIYNHIIITLRPSNVLVLCSYLNRERRVLVSWGVWVGDNFILKAQTVNILGLWGIKSLSQLLISVNRTRKQSDKWMGAVCFNKLLDTKTGSQLTLNIYLKIVKNEITAKMYWMLPTSDTCSNHFTWILFFSYGETEAKSCEVIGQRLQGEWVAELWFKSKWPQSPGS